MIKIIRDASLWFLIQDSKEKKIIVYTERKYKKKLERLFYNIDVKIDYYINDDDEEFMSPYDLIMEDLSKIMVVVAVDDFANAKNILNGIGLNIGINYKNICKYSLESHSRPYYYDPICGFNVFTQGKYNGFGVFGDTDADIFRVLTLGGSTTDCFVYPFKSWSEYMHEVLDARGINNVVFCGGVNGYSSSEELFKLIRDGLSIKPDLIINYSGCNDIKLGDYPYINSYMIKISEFLQKSSALVATRFDTNPFGITFGMNDTDGGEEFDASNYHFWIKNERIVHAICSEFGIRHITIHQPNLCSGRKELSTYEEEYILNSCYCGIQKQPLSENIRISVEFRTRAQKDAKRFPWLFDFSSIFDETEDVYIDRLHVKEKGNRIIAEKICDILLSEGYIER